MRLTMRNLLKFVMVGLVALPGFALIKNTPAEVQPEALAKATSDVEKKLGSKLTGDEKIVLEFFMKRGIQDRMALAVLLGNIKQESRFISNICEGGARVPYNQCKRGGYGLIQWTTKARYNGLGTHALITGGDPSSLETQLSYLVTEGRWLAIEHKFKTPGQSMDYYMDAAYYWLGWGVHGNRTLYSHDYYANLG